MVLVQNIFPNCLKHSTAISSTAVRGDLTYDGIGGLAGIRARQLGSFTLRQDRYRRPEDCPDSIEVPPFDRFPPVADPNEPSRQLRLNYRCEMGGWIRAELIPVIGPMTHPQIDALEGFSFADCVTMDGDELEKVVSWKGKEDIARLSDTMAVRIEMYRTTLFSFSL